MFLTTRQNASLSHAINTTPSAAGEKQAPVLIARASGLDEANFRVASQSIR